MMIGPVKEFLCKWVASHIHDEPYVEADRPDPRVASFAARCREDAAAAGVAPDQLNAAASDLEGAPSLEAFMALQIDVSAQKHHDALVRHRS